MVQCTMPGVAPGLILCNGKLHTQDPDFPDAADQPTAVAIAHRRFLAVGDDATIRALAGPDTRTIDLGGRVALPGLIDAHFHLYSWILSRRRLSLVDAGSLQDLRQRVAEAARGTPVGDWIAGQGWNETRWPEPQMPTRVDLDAVAPHHPVILWRSDLHLAVANSRAFQEAGITRETQDPPMGRIDRDDSGRPTGILRELAINLVSNIIPPPPEEKLLDALRRDLGVLHGLGLTGVHDHRIMGGTDGLPAFRAYQQLQAAGDLTLRLWMDIPGERLDEAVALGLRTGFGDDTLRVGHVKLFADGSQGARTAWLLEPYDDGRWPGDCGMPLTPLEEIAEAVAKADRAGLAVAVHAIGDRTIRELITVFEEHAGHSMRSVPHRIEHVQIIRPSDVERLARLGIAASVQPIHATDDIPLCDTSIGARSCFAYPFRDMLDAGVMLAFGSDAPVADPNPLWGIHAAVTRQERGRGLAQGTPAGGWYPEQRLTVAQAVWGFTMGPAIVSGQESTLGSISPGKLADLVVLDRDIFSVEPMEIHRARAAMTVFDGQIVYEE